ncbi:unnamed protein product [Dibothriocephalus latus]|uniref:Protein kinase domain-containing protein n=1 Tax=Dibothriocephalus latus TaxID=60516 RepID=A0A3P6Q6T5_DIBLA|nr:unnamed protein product [Dibothriocephalus latus]
MCIIIRFFLLVPFPLLRLLFQYANGGSLVDLLTGSSRLPWITRTKIANDIASGVGYLHERQLIHRDLSSQVSCRLALPHAPIPLFSPSVAQIPIS